MSAPQASCLLYFDDEEAPALRLSQAAGLTALAIERHRFPDDELRLRLPASLPARVVLYRSLHRPNEKLLELLLVAGSSDVISITFGLSVNAVIWTLRVLLFVLPPITGRIAVQLCRELQARDRAEAPVESDSAR